MAPKKATLGVVENHIQAGNVIAKLRLQGFPPSFLSILFADDSGDAASGKADQAGFVELGFFSNTDTLMIPGVGRVVAAGAIADLLRNAPGGLVGCLTSLGIPILETRQCERDLRAGSIVIAVHVENPRLRAFVQETFKCYGAVGIDASSSDASFDSAA